MWYTNDNQLARFDEEDVTPFNEEYVTPFNITTRSDIFNATVRVTSVVEVNGYFSFDNFTLTARVSDFLSLQGQNLTCGTLLDRSEPFQVNNFSIGKCVLAEIILKLIHTLNVMCKWIWKKGPCGTKQRVFMLLRTRLKTHCYVRGKRLNTWSDWWLNLNPYNRANALHVQLTFLYLAQQLLAII